MVRDPLNKTLSEVYTVKFSATDRLCIKVKSEFRISPDSTCKSVSKAKSPEQL